MNSDVAGSTHWSGNKRQRIETKRQEGNQSRGSASIELAISLPIIAIAMLTIVQVSLLVWDQMRIVHGAREAARVLAVTNDPDKATRAALDSASLDDEHTDVAIEPDTRPIGTPGRVTVRYTPPIVVPFMGQFSGVFTLTATIEMRMERDPP